MLSRVWRRHAPGAAAVRLCSSLVMYMPKDVNLHRAKKVLEISFLDGGRCILPAELLRVFSPSVHGQGRVLGGRRGVGIIDLEMIGNYGVRLQFDDMHGSGIYTWERLRWLGDHKFTLAKRYINQLRHAGKSRDPPLANNLRARRR